MIKSFDIPQQVRIKHEAEEDKWIYGIAYGNYVICGCCGATIPLDEILEIHTFEWLDLTNAIRDGESDDIAGECIEMIYKRDE